MNQKSKAKIQEQKPTAISQIQKKINGLVKRFAASNQRAGCGSLQMKHHGWQRCQGKRKGIEVMRQQSAGTWKL